MEKYYFWLTDDKFIYATFIAMNEQDLEYATAQGFAEVSPSLFAEAKPTSRYVDGKLIPAPEYEPPEQPEAPPPVEPEPEPQPELPVQQEPFELRYFVELDSEKYIIGCYIAFTPAELDTLLEKDYPEISKSSYESIGPDAKLVDGKVIKGEHREPLVSAEGNAAIRDARVAKASEMIGLLVDATDPEIVDEVDPQDVALLKKWRQYRVALAKIDVNAPVWPAQPA